MHFSERCGIRCLVRNTVFSNKIIFLFPVLLRNNRYISLHTFKAYSNVAKNIFFIKVSFGL